MLLEIWILSSSTPRPWLASSVVRPFDFGIPSALLWQLCSPGNWTPHFEL